jgi:hypothetical protein
LPQGEKRNLGGVDVEFIFTNGGHSPGDIMIYRLLGKNFDSEIKQHVHMMHQKKT